MPCSYCRSRSHNINGCVKHSIDRLDSILNLGKDPVIKSGRNAEWFKDQNGKSPMDDGYEVVKEIKFYNYRNTSNTPSAMNDFVKFYFENYNSDKKISKIKNAIRFAALKKQFIKENNTTNTLKDSFVSYHGYKVSYDNSSSRFKVEVLTDTEITNKFALDAECEKNLRSNVKEVFQNKNPVYHNLIQKYQVLINSINDLDGEQTIVAKHTDFVDYLNSNIDPNNSFIKTFYGFRPELERSIQEAKVRAEQQARERQIEQERIRQERRAAREEQYEIERRRHRERQNQRMEELRAREAEVYRKLEEKKQNLIFKEKAIEATECPICMEELGGTNKVILRCGHQFCGDCLFTHLQKEKGSDCPCCRAEYVVRPLGWLPPRVARTV
tara:strand:- start:579 stop:1730 length:1152 start_codon:yes stop_codon:yes gene_type:complete